MAKFGYTSKRSMDPRPGRTYATEYYKQSKHERRRTQEHVAQTIVRVGDRATESDSLEVLTQPMTKFRRKETKGAYSAFDIMNDLYEQMKSGKDIPSGMLGRWNRLFEGTGCEIDMVLESELPAKHPILGDLTNGI